MTSIRFVGMLPLWLGLMLALVGSMLAWRYYRREAHSHTGLLRWTLPLSRSLVIFLVVFVLSGPVLHHRDVVGVLGRVLIYLDSSQSMGATDEHMSDARKVLVAQQLGWLPSAQVDTRVWELAEELASIREDTAQLLQAEPGSETVLKQCRGLFVKRLGSVDREWRELDGDWSFDNTPSEIAASPTEQDSDEATEESSSGDARDQLARDVLARATAITSSPVESSASPSASVADSEQILLQLCDDLVRYESFLRRVFDRQIQEQVDGDEAIRSALVQFDATPRWRRAELGLLDDKRGVVSGLRQAHDVQILALSEDHVDSKWDGRTGTEQPSELLELPAGKWTNLASGVNATTLRSGVGNTTDGRGEAERRTAVVLISDGRHNSGPSPQQVARLLGQQGVTVYSIGMGSRREPPDLAILEMQFPDIVFQRDDVRGEMTIRDKIPAGRPFVIEIRHQDDVLWRKELVTQDVSRRRIEFEFSVTDLVERLQNQFDPRLRQHAVPLTLEAAIAPLEEETEVANNTAVMRLAAITQTYSILLIDGRSRWETRYLRNAFQRDTQWSIDTLIVGPGTDDESLPRGDVKGTFPTDRERLFGYDLIVFGEVSPDVWSDHELGWIREFVEQRGGGLLVIDDQRQLLREYTDDNFASLIPVLWNDAAIQTLPIQLQLTERGAKERAFRLTVDEAENRRLWGEFPPPHTLSSVEALPDAEMLLDVSVDDKRFPVMVLRSFGAGRVFYSASDETWRWRYKSADTYHQRFWIQLANAMMAKPFAVSDEYASLDTGAASYPHGAAADIRVRLVGLDGRPATNTTVDALLWMDGQVVSTASLEPDAAIPGIFRGRTSVLEDGHYEVTLQASGYSREVLKAKTQFVVEPLDTGELEEIACNEELLREVAGESRGQYLREEQFGKLVDLLRPLSNGQVVESDTLLWQSYWWFSAIVGLLALEWMLRKRAGLL